MADKFDKEKATKREYRDPRCRECGNPVGRAEAKKRGGYRYHAECLAQRPRARQQWTGSGWKRIGFWSDEEQATMEAHSG